MIGSHIYISYSLQGWCVLSSYRCQEVLFAGRRGLEAVVQDPVQGFGTQRTVMMKRWQILSVVYRAHIQCDIWHMAKRTFLLRPAIHCCIGSYKSSTRRVLMRAPTVSGA